MDLDFLPSNPPPFIAFFLSENHLSVELNPEFSGACVQQWINFYVQTSITYEILRKSYKAIAVWLENNQQIIGFNLVLSGSTTREKILIDDALAFYRASSTHTQGSTPMSIITQLSSHDYDPSYLLGFSSFNGDRMVEKLFNHVSAFWGDLAVTYAETGQRFNISESYAETLGVRRNLYLAEPASTNVGRWLNGELSRFMGHLERDRRITDYEYQAELVDGQIALWRVKQAELIQINGVSARVMLFAAAPEPVRTMV